MNMLFKKDKLLARGFVHYEQPKGCEYGDSMWGEELLTLSNVQYELILGCECGDSV